jgi:hypothetical protein
MQPNWTVYGQLDQDIRDEETFNNCFADLIDDSLALDAGFLNHLLGNEVTFEDDAKVEGTDLEPLSYRNEGTDRKIDFTIGDSSKIVGFESKRRDSLSKSQLEDELAKLEHNADGRDAILIAITEDIRKPSLIKELSVDIRWTSWFQISQFVFSGGGLGEEWQPTISRARKMFREFGYEGFDGIDTEEFRVSVWELWKQAATQIDGLDTGERWPYQTIKEPKGTSTGWKPIDPDWMLLTFSDGASGDPNETCYAMLSNKRSQELRVGLAIRPWQDEALQEFLCDNAEALADCIIEAELEVVQFPLNWLVGRKNLPKGTKKAVTAENPSSREELVSTFSDRAGMEGDGANRFVLGYPVELSNALEESVTSLEKLRDLFETNDGPAIEALLSESRSQ